MTPRFLASRGNALRAMKGQQMILDSVQGAGEESRVRRSQLQTDVLENRVRQTQPAQPVLPVTACVRVLLVDEHEIVRKGLSALFAEQDDFEVVGEAASGNLAIAMAIQLQPDIILLDIMSKEANGLDIAQQLQRACPGGRIVIFTGLSDEMHLFRAMRIGVQGYLQKGLSLKQILEALRAIYRGERVIGEQHAITQVLNEFSRLTKEQERARSGLSDLEIELIRLAAQGCSNKEIASRQFWSEVTVKRKMQDIYRKLQVADRAQAVAEAMRMGLI